MEYLAQNWPALLAAFAAGIALLKAIAVLTPTKKDDALVERLESVEKMVKDFLPTDASKAPTEVIEKK